MHEAPARNLEKDGSGIYQIRLKGHLDSRWIGWFDDMKITLTDNGDTLLTGPVVDQAALYGLLRKVRDLGMMLLEVVWIKPVSAAVANSSH